MRKLRFGESVTGPGHISIAAAETHLEDKRGVFLEALFLPRQTLPTKTT